MLKTIQHNDKDILVVVAKLLTGAVPVKNKVADQAAFISKNETFDAGFVAHVCAWQGNHNITADGVIGKDTWAAIANDTPTCSTSKLKTSAVTLACQLLLGGNLTCDAIYGPRTKAAVVAFQSTAGLSADGICGPKTWAALIGVKESKSDTTGKVINPYVHYLQWDSRWGKKKYSTHTSSQTIGNSGCGPTAVAQVLATWEDPAITPVEMCKLALDNGFRTYDSGTKGEFCEFVANKYDCIKSFTRTRSVKTLVSALKKGALAVCCMNSNDEHFWTTGGHYITAVGFDDNNIYAADPNKKECPRKQLQSKFGSCLKQAWIFWPAEKEETADPFDGVDDGEHAGDAPQRGDAIIDISKWQPTVNYDKLVKATSLIILRAGRRGTGGSIKIDECFIKHADALKKLGIPFGVYFYSIAKNKSMAQEEARMFWKYAKEYNPLFWALDVEKDAVTHSAISAFVKELRKLGAFRVGCYVAHELYPKYDYDSLRELFDFTWIPRYGSNKGTVASSIKPNYSCDLWQYTSTGSISGISGNVDLNIITGTGKTLSWFLGGDT